jgi:hypothetical protein
VLASALDAVQASSDASVELLEMALELVSSQQAQLLSALQAGSPPGLGGSVNTYA